MKNGIPSFRTLSFDGVLADVDGSLLILGHALAGILKATAPQVNQVNKERK